MSRQALIVGAGIAGLAIGHRLATEGWRVTIIDRSMPGSGASKAALGSLTPYSDEYSTDATRTLARQSVGSYPAWLKQLERDSGKRVDFDNRGLIEFAITSTEEAKLRKRFKGLTEAKSPVRLLTPKAVLKLEPEVNQDVLLGLHYLDEPFVDVLQLLEACEAAVRAIGCVITSNMKALRVLTTDGIVSGVETTQGIIRSKVVIVTAGYGTSGLDGAPPLRLTRVRGEVLELKGPPGLLSRHVYCDHGFITPRRDGRLLVGSTYDEHRSGDDENPDTVSVGNARLILNATARMVPVIERFQILRYWKGWRHCSADGQPVIGRWGLEGLFVATGFSGLGFTLAPGTAELILNLVSDRNQQSPDEFRPDRFATYAPTSHAGAS